MKNTVGVWGTLVCMLAWALAGPAGAVQVPGNQLLPDPEKELGDPVVLIQLGPGQEKETAYRELKKHNQYILGYREISLQGLNTEHPILVTWTYNQKEQKTLQTIFNWKAIDSIQLLDAKIKVPEQAF
jgi:hypothetical protein